MTDISDWYPEEEFWILVRKNDDNEIVVTHKQLQEAFKEEGRLIRVKNGFDPYFHAYKKT